MPGPTSTLEVTNNTGSSIVINGQTIVSTESYTWSGQDALVAVCQDFVFRVCLLAGTIGVELNGQEISQTVAMTSPVFSQLLDDIISGAVTAED